MATLSVRDLVKIYRGRRVVDKVNLEVTSGRVIGLLGPNGAGKTTTFYMTVGLIKPDGGRVFLDDMDITQYPMHIRARKGVGYLPQEASVFRKLTVRQNILAILETLPLSRRQRNERADRLLAELGITHVANSKAAVLSGGERRRLEISRALATEPAFMLLDEPFAGVDPISVNDIKGIIRHLKERGIGVLITDHNVRETLDICDTAYIVSAGHIIANGDAHTVLANQQVRDVYLGADFRL